MNMNTGVLPAKRSRGRGAWPVAWLAVTAATLCLAAASCSGPAAPTASSPQVNALSVKSCTVAGLTARCGTLIVPEDRLTGKGRTISVRFVVIPATGPDRAPDPVVWFAGGPGDSAVDDIPGERASLGDLNVHRDLVFIDQRGTGGSNPLNCPVFRGSLADKPPLRAASSPAWPICRAICGFTPRRCSSTMSTRSWVICTTPRPISSASPTG